MFDENINEMEHIYLIHDVKVSCENVINQIPLTVMSEQLCQKYFSFHLLRKTLTK